jgi:hypothetical protein
LVCAVLAAPVSLAQQQLPDLPSRGLSVGKVIFLPFAGFDYRVDDNVFRRSEELDPTGDRIATYTAGVGVVVPVRNSLFALNYQLSKRNYAVNNFPRNLDHDLGLNFTFNFGSGDTLVVSDNYTIGSTDLQRVDAGGELVFDGEPFRYNNLQFALDRTIPGRWGYSARISRIDFAYEEQDPGEPPRNLAFFDYSGYDMGFEYRHPLAGNRWIVGYVGARRFDHFETDLANAEPFRREVSDTLQVGIRGLVHVRDPYFVRVGYTKFEYELTEGTGFNGFVFDGRWRTQLSPRTNLDASARRFPLPSAFDTYYIINELRTGLAHQWLRLFTVGGNVRVSANRYGDLIPIQDCSDVIRRDLVYDVEGYVDIMPAQMYRFRVAVARLQRDSNCPTSTYTANVVTAGFRFGWF